jgi:hypothetical protein
MNTTAMLAGVGAMLFTAADVPAAPSPARYTIDEIALMRHHVRHLNMACLPHDAGLSYICSSDDAEELTEIRLQTYLLNGTRPEELAAASRKRYDWGRKRGGVKQ